MRESGGRRSVCLITAVLAMLTASTAYAQTSIDTSSSFYYEIGGGRAISESVTGSTAVDLTASIYAGLSYSCGDFDLEDNVKELFKEWETMAEDLWDSLIKAFGGAVASLPAYMLQRANPGLYEVLTNAIARYEQIVQLSYRDCKEMEEMVSRGENPYDDWIKVAKGEAWQQGVEDGKTATETEEELNDEIRRNGVLWRGGERCGGEETGPCMVIEDVVREGYSQLDIGPGDKSLIRRYFATEDAAVDWARVALGTYEPSMTDTIPTQRTAGQGLSVLVYEVTENVEELIEQMLRTTATSVRSAENYQLVSAPGVKFTKSILDSLIDLHPTDRDVMKERLASEIAASQIMDRALTLRRLIRAGVMEANIANTQAAKFMINVALPELTEEIESLLLEKQVRDEFVTGTVAKLLERSREMRNNDMPRGSSRSTVSPIRGGVPTPTSN